MTYEDILLELAQNDERYMVVTAENRAAIRNLPQKLGNRFFDTGITEQTMIGAAAGLALRGRIPVTHALATFLTMRAFEFIRTDVGISGLPVKLVGYVPGVLSEANGPTHQAVEDVALMRGIPNVNVYCPADYDDMLIGIRQVLQSNAPFYIRYNDKPAVYKHSTDFAIGKAETIGEGSDVAILVYGYLFGQAIKARDILAQQGIRARIVNLRTVKPIDEEAVLAAIHTCTMTVTLEDHFQIGGLYSILGELALKHRIGGLNVLPIALDNKWFKPALLNDVLEYEGLNATHIAARIARHFATLRAH